MNNKIHANGTDVSLLKINQTDYLSLTDIARYRSDEPSAVIANWMRNRDTIEFLGLWEEIHNKTFNSLEFEGIESESGRNSFAISPKKWIEKTGAVGIVSKGGRYGGAYAHQDIAFEFASYVSPKFKLFIVKDYQRLKSEENARISNEWTLSRAISKINYSIHTDAIKRHIIPNKVSGNQIAFTYASEADVLNIALFGKTAKQWRSENPNSQGNIRDHASLEQLIVLSNLESLNAEYIRLKLPQKERLERLNESAIIQMKSLVSGGRLVGDIGE